MENDNFFWGGPVHKILLKFKLEREPKSAVIRKIMFFSLFAWLPLLILNIINSTAFNPALNISLLTDYVVWIRFFAALPMIFISERIIKSYVGDALVHFIDSGIVAENNVAEYKSILMKFNKLRDSKKAEVIILFLSYAVVLLFWMVNDRENLNSTWVFGSNKEISTAGYWYYFVSAPVFQFFLYRMFWKFFLWAAFLFKVSRMKLNLIPTNPDLSAGLKFLGITQVFCGLIGLAQGCVVSAQIAERIILNNTQLADYKITIVVNILVLSFLFMLPLMFFITKLIKVKLKGILDYGVVAHKYTNAFDDRWVKGINPENEQLLGTGDIQSLADLFNSYQIVEKMRMIPIDARQIIAIILIITIPFLPLITFVIPPKEILQSLIKFFL
jgi:hypothetical protein